ncbi:uncharacterized protein [Thunnus thynnus]|uniref:uncharacterized protein n=1 Tax=Thunnus thynnus TaxID=8237 RepID=UPI0035290AA0
MSIDEKLLFEGFLQKRKDTLKIIWVTYWFRLQNTTLFFYTKKNGNASHLRGYYYIYTVQSVREVQRTDSKRFMFEINMTNGKRKVLAAETDALRKEWVGQLWKAMHLSTSAVSDSRGTQLRVCEQRERRNSSTPIYSESDSVTEFPPARPLSAPAPPGYIHHENSSLTSPICPTEEPDTEDAPFQNTLPACNYQHHDGDSLNQSESELNLWSSELSDTEDKQGDYDVLPLRNKTCTIDIDPSTETNEGVYDFPLSYKRASDNQDATDSIYDVPSSLLRQMSDDTEEEQPEEGAF